MNVVHVFPYSARVSGGHANAIRGFLGCQRAKGINAVGISPASEPGPADAHLDFPLAEVELVWELRWATIADRFGIRAGESLLHLHSVDRRYAPLLTDLRRAGVAYALTSHGQLNFRSAAHGLAKFVYLNGVNRIARRAAGLHLLSTFAARRLRLLLPGYRGLQLIQGNIVGIPKLSGMPAGSRSDYALPANAFVLVFVGRLDVRVKGLDLLVEAFSRLPPGRFQLVLAGPDWENGRSQLEALARRLDCSDRVHFPGPVYGSRKWSLLRMADLFISPSRWEAFGIGQVEAMTAGVPVVTSATGSLAQDLKEAGAAWLTPLAVEPMAKAIATLEADRALRKTLGERGRAWAESNCNPDLAGARFEGFYQAILERTGGAGR